MEIEKDRHRKFTRIEMVQQARLDFEGISYDPCRIKDISLTGMFVYCAIDQSAGAECTVRYSQTCLNSHFYFKAKAQVVRKTDEGVAIEFTSMPMDSYMLLQTTLLYEAIDPLEIGLELPESCPFEITIDISREPNQNDPLNIPTVEPDNEDIDPPK